MLVIPFGPRIRSALAVVVVALSVALTAPTAVADEVDWIPSDALVVFKINNVERVNREAVALLKEFGVAEQAPEMADPLAAFQAQSGLREGLNLAGNAVIYLANGDMDGEAPPIVILVPVTDYQAFLKNFPASKDLGDGITQVRFPDEDQDQAEEIDWDDGDSGYVMQAGDHAALTPVRELLKKPEQAIRFAGVTAQMLQERDIVAYANMEQVGPMALEHLQQEEFRAELKQELAGAFEENPEFAKFQPVAEAAIDQFLTLAENFLRDSSAGAASLDLSDIGIRFGGAGQFKPGSSFARMVSQLKTSDELLSGLPEATYVVFGGSTDNREANQEFFNEFAGPIVEKLKGIEGAEKMGEYIEVVKAQMGAAGETRFGLLAPSGPLGAASLLQYLTIQGGDVDTLLQTNRRMAELQPEIMAALLPPEAQGMGMGMAMKYEQGAKEVGGVSFDKLSGDMSNPDVQAQMMPLRMIFGPEGPSTYIGKVDDKLLSFGGLSDQQIAQAIESVRGNGSPLAEDAGVQLVNGQLLERESAVVFFRPDELVRAGLGYGRQMGMNVPIQLPEDLPPIGFAMGPAENAFRTEGFVHKDLISALIVAGLQAQQHFGGMDDGL